jgi:hypothetical protein
LHKKQNAKRDNFTNEQRSRYPHTPDLKGDYRLILVERLCHGTNHKALRLSQ